MNCQTFKAVVQDIDQPGGVEETMREEALAHAEGCPRCFRRLQSARALAVALDVLSRADEFRQAPPRVEERLKLAFRAEIRQRPRARRIAWALAATAALTFALGAGFLWHRIVAPGGGQAPNRLPTVQAQATSQPQPVQTAKPKSSHPPTSGRRVLRRRPQPAPAEPREPVILPGQEMAGFLPLPFADRDEPIGAGALVRIQLSEASLGMLGVPVTDSRSSQPVTADVVLGQDGSARAIRFVSGPVPSGLGEQLQSMSFATKGAER
jgi:hypothetical protein